MLILTVGKIVDYSNTSLIYAFKRLYLILSPYHVFHVCQDATTGVFERNSLMHGDVFVLAWKKAVMFGTSKVVYFRWTMVNFSAGSRQVSISTRAEQLQHSTPMILSLHPVVGSASHPHPHPLIQRIRSNCRILHLGFRFRHRLLHAITILGLVSIGIF